MAVIGITGGIATGKSSFVRALFRQLPGELFDADQTARELLESDPEVRIAVQREFGESIYDSFGKPDRIRLREVVFAGKENRRRLEAILHPAIRTRWTTIAEQHRLAGSFFFVDIPLLFETGAETYFDRIVVVACSAATQQRRLLEQRGLSLELAKRILGAQLDLGIKIKKADHLIWNDSTVSCLDGQASLLACWLRQYYG
ncbi:dephospho-CoA kinase [Verrucomicrobiota bacterium sgz303538]